MEVLKGMLLLHFLQNIVIIIAYRKQIGRNFLTGRDSTYKKVRWLGALVVWFFIINIAMLIVKVKEVN